MPETDKTKVMANARYFRDFLMYFIQSKYSDEGFLKVYSIPKALSDKISVSSTLANKL